MKRINLFLLAAAMIIGISAHAQSEFPISKGVQRVANKQKLESPAFDQHQVKATSVPLPALVVSKSVQSIPNPALITTETQGNIKSKGTPAWVNAKGVHQMKKSNNKKESAPTPVEDQLVRVK